jgi:hypothetical protein
LFGWKVRVDEDEEGGDGLVAVMDFGFNCSTGVLKCVAVSAHGKYLACGGTDERIRVFNVAENRSMGELGLHEGGITCLAFFDDTHMISGSEVCALFSVPRPRPPLARPHFLIRLVPVVPGRVAAHLALPRLGVHACAARAQIGHHRRRHPPVWQAGAVCEQRQHAQAVEPRPRCVTVLRAPPCGTAPRVL